MVQLIIRVDVKFLPWKYKEHLKNLQGGGIKGAEYTPFVEIHWGFTIALSDYYDIKIMIAIARS